MKKIAALFAVVLVSCSGVPPIPTHFGFDLQLIQLKQMTKSQRAYIKQSCPCEGNKFITDQCHQDAELVLVVEARADWMFQRELYNKGWVSSPPEKDTPPEIPTVVCPLPGGE